MLHGREAEQRRIDALLADAARGRSAALVLRGDPGIGKTALLDYAAARGIPTARGAGIESEAELPYAALHLLVRPGMALVDTLPGPQRTALRAAFGLTADPADRMLIGLALLSLLVEEAADGPLLCVIDDAHWLDRASAETLLFAARRLDAEGVVMLFAARDGGFPAPGLPELTVGALPQEAAAALIDSRAPDLAPALRYRLLVEAAGNPLALLELPASLAADSSWAGPNPLPLTERLRVAFHARVSRLPAATATLLLIAAAAGTADLASVLRAAELLGAGLPDLAAAEEAGLVHTDGRALHFRHPLLRSAVYRGAPLADRLAAHRALATALVDESEADLRAWHLASAAIGPDETAAAALETAAHRAGTRNGQHGAAAAYERAADLSPHTGDRVRRLVLAAEAATETGQLEHAAELAERASELIGRTSALAERRGERAYEPTEHTVEFARRTGEPTGPTDEFAGSTDEPAGRTGELAGHHPRAESPTVDGRAETAARLDLVRATAEFGAGRAQTAHRLLLGAARALRGSDPERAGRVLSQAVHTAWYLGAGELAEVRALWAELPHAADDPMTPIARYVLGAVDGECTVPLREAAAAAREFGADGPADLVQMCGAGLIVGQDDQVAELVSDLVAESREGGRITVLPPLLFFRAEAELFLGRPREAEVAATEGLRIARDLGSRHWISQQTSFLAYLAALAGNETRCREAAADAVAEEWGGATAAGAPWAHAALGLLDLGLGRAESALSRFAPLTVEPARHHVIGLRTLPDLVEAAVRVGAPARAGDAVDRLAHWADTSDQAWIRALERRCRALLAPDDEAERHYRAALVDETHPFELARTRLLYGEWLRRDRRKTEARGRLESAVEIFDRLGAVPWAARARTELAALGVGAASRPAEGVLATLTPQELQIVRLAARGLSNRDIAAQLFLSPRTVGHHLYKAYPKLDVRSRAGLPDLPLDPD